MDRPPELAHVILQLRKTRLIIFEIRNFRNQASCKVRGEEIREGIWFYQFPLVKNLESWRLRGGSIMNGIIHLVRNLWFEKKEVKRSFIWQLRGVTVVLFVYIYYHLTVMFTDNMITEMEE